MCLTDLVFVNDGNPKFHKNGYINFHKWKLQSATAQLLLKAQKAPYQLEIVPFIQNYLDVPPLVTDENTLYELSAKLEASQNDDMPEKKKKTQTGDEKDLWKFVYQEGYEFSTPDVIIFLLIAQ